MFPLIGSSPSQRSCRFFYPVMPTYYSTHFTSAVCRNPRAPHWWTGVSCRQVSWWLPPICFNIPSLLSPLRSPYLPTRLPRCTLPFTPSSRYLTEPPPAHRPIVTGHSRRGGGPPLTAAGLLFLSRPIPLLSASITTILADKPVAVNSPAHGRETSSGPGGFTSTCPHCPGPTSFISRTATPTSSTSSTAVLPSAWFRTALY